jgi:hypothetical protein
MRRREFLSLIALAASGCAYPNTRDPLYRTYPTEVPEKHGVVFGSLGYLGRTPYTSTKLFFRAKGYELSRPFSYAHGLRTGFPDFSEAEARGIVFFAQLAPAEYEIFAFELSQFRAQFGSTTFRSDVKFSIPFSVAEGRVTYLGQFLSVAAYGKNVFGMAVPGGGYFVFSDKMERDIRLLQNEKTDFDFANTHRALIDPKLLGLPFFREALIEPASSL